MSLSPAAPSSLTQLIWLRTLTQALRTHFSMKVVNPSVNR